MIGECDLGHRVVVRRRVGSLLTDVLGELMAVDQDQLTVRTDRGAEIAIPVAEVQAAKRIPPRRAKYSEIAALELIADRAWPAPTVERLGDWRLRAAEGWTNRANSVLPLGDPGLPLPEAVDACERWYADRGLDAMITVPMPLRRDVDDLLVARGWQARPVVLVQAAPLAAVLGALSSGDVPRVELAERPSEGFLAAMGSWKSVPPPVALSILSGPDKVRFAQVTDDAGAVVATARAAVIDDWMHLGLVNVAEAARRQGLAQRVSQALAEWAAGAGATRAVLQVEEHNLAAVALYSRLGFRTHHTYRTHALQSR